MRSLALRLPALAVVAACLALSGADAVAQGKGGGGGNVAPKFTVTVTAHFHPPAPSHWLPTCPAQTPDARTREIVTTAFFPRHDPCAILTTSFGYQLTDDLRINTIKNNIGAITGVQVTGQDIEGKEGVVHQSEVVPVNPPVMPFAGNFTLHLDATGVPMWRLDTHTLKQNSKRVDMVGTFTINDINYVLQSP